jgi:hypothetical protein
MFLYFHEAKIIVGLTACLTQSFYYREELLLKECDEFYMNEQKEDDEWFNGWETEENWDGTFYMVFKTQENKKYYLQQTELNRLYLHTSNKRYKLVEFCNDINMAQKLVFDDDETIVYSTQPKKYLGIVKNNNLVYRLVEKYVKNDDDGFYSKVCLTETSCLNSYTLK